MKVLWLCCNGKKLAHWKIRREFEQVIGKDNVVFYGKPLNHIWSTLVDPHGMMFYPEKFNIFKKYKKEESSAKLIIEAIKEEQPDIIMSEGFYGMKGIDVPRVKTIGDAHNEWGDNKTWAETGQVDMIMPRCYSGGVGFRVKNELCTVGYFPFSASSSLFYDAHLERTNDVCLAGCMNAHYIIRLRIFHYVATKYGKPVPYNKPFSVENITYLRASLVKYPQYVQALNTSKILATSNGIPSFPCAITKFFEGLACGMLVMSDMPPEYRALRFEPDKNIVEINSENFLEKFRYYLENESERKRIARNGRELFLKYHTKEEHSKQLIAQFEELINSKNEERPFDSRNVKGEAGRMLRILEEDEGNFDKNGLLYSCMEKGRSEWLSWSGKVHSLYAKVLQGELTIEEWEKLAKSVI